MKTWQDEVVFCSSGCDQGGKSVCSFPEPPAPQPSAGPARSEMTHRSTKAALDRGGTKDFYLGPRCESQALEST
ncbi:hypothetical protein Q5P01_002108 [Channa striata]|uniref:Uncharacterized protein n=1 Tax=Channa striata TaxID=64152 RepID=A0AA88NQH3_CHASR|nr:hypothetical protein Q5P01_002108 [Channa striata]